MVGFEPTIWDPYKWAPCLPADIIITSILYCKYTFLLDTLQKYIFFVPHRAIWATTQP